jgi:hypothetical protein
MYVPAGSVTPGRATGWLNVKYVRLSDVFVNALAPLAAPTSTTNTEVVISLFNMLVLLPTIKGKMPARSISSRTNPRAKNGLRQ